MKHVKKVWQDQCPPVAKSMSEKTVVKSSVAKLRVAKS